MFLSVSVVEAVHIDSLLPSNRRTVSATIASHEMKSSGITRGSFLDGPGPPRVTRSVAGVFVLLQYLSLEDHFPVSFMICVCRRLL